MSRTYVTCEKRGRYKDTDLTLHSRYRLETHPFLVEYAYKLPDGRLLVDRYYEDTTHSKDSQLPCHHWIEDNV